MTSIEKRYVYKISRDGVFLGVLQNVASEFQTSQQLYTSGTELNVTVGLFPDVSNQTVGTIQDETAANITDETGAALYDERTQDVFGDVAPDILIRCENDIQVIMYNTANPTGRVVFAGYISKWKVNYGSENTISFTALNYGTELDNVMIEGGNTSDQSQTTAVSAATTYYDLSISSWIIYGQTFTTGVGITNIKSIDLKVSATSSQTWTVKLYSSTTLANPFTGNTPLGTATATVSTGGVATVVNFAFPAAVTVTASTSYFFAVYAGTGINNRIYYNSGVPYANGAAYQSTYAGGGGTGDFYILPQATVPAADLYFVTYTTTGATSNPYTATDPGNITKAIMDLYIAVGGNVTYSASTIDLAGYTVSYTFQVNTILEGIQKMSELSPYDFYWYVDPATNVLYFKETLTTATHKLVYKRHIGELNMEQTSENIRNIVYFSGGDIGGGVNLFAKYSNTTSLANHRQGLERLSDNRVTTSANAQLLANDVLNNNNNPVYTTTITIPDGVYDIESFDLGETVGFAGFGNFIDNLVLQIVSIDRNPDYVTLTVGQLKPRSSTTVETLRRDLDKLQTVDNPSAPS